MALKPIPELNCRESLCLNQTDLSDFLGTSGAVWKWQECVTSTWWQELPMTICVIRKWRRYIRDATHVPSRWCQAHWGWHWHYLEGLKPKLKLGTFRVSWGGTGERKSSWVKAHDLESAKVQARLWLSVCIWAHSQFAAPVSWLWGTLLSTEHLLSSICATEDIRE